MRSKGVFGGIVWLLLAGMIAGCGEGVQTENAGSNTELMQEMHSAENVQRDTEITQEKQKKETGQPENDLQSETAEQSEDSLQSETERQSEKDAEEMPAESETESTATEAPVFGAVPLLLIETENKERIADDEIYTKCTVSVTNCEAGYEIAGAQAGIRIRGNSTQMYAKKPYRIKFEEKQQVLGLSEGAHKSWVLLAEFNDPTLLRNLITYRLANALSGISYATDCSLVEVYLNGEYAGVYLLAEQTQVDADRIAIDESGVKDATVTDTGYLLELEADLGRRKEEGNEGEAWFAVTGYASETDNSMQMLMERTFDETAAYYVVKSDARSAEQMTYIKEYMIRVYDAVYQEKTKEAVEQLVDLPSAVDMYLVQLLANDFDNNYSSMYLYKDAGGKLMFGAPWDFDLAYGNFTGYTEAEDTVYVYHLLRRLGEYDWFRDMVAERYTEVFKGETGLLAQMKETVATLTGQYAEVFDREYAAWRDDLVGMNGFGGFGQPGEIGGFGGFGQPGEFGGWELPEGAEGFGGWGTWELPEGAEGFGGWGAWELPEGAEGFEDWGAWELPEGAEGFGGWGAWELPEGAEGFGGWGAWEQPEGAEGFGGFGQPGDFGAFGGFGDMGNFSYGAVYDTHEEAVEALLDWLEARVAWMDKFLAGTE